MFTLLKNSLLFLIAAAIMFGSFGLLINKHYCKGRLTETSILLANKGCAKDVSLIDRLLHRLDDCHEGHGSEGINKLPCCEFDSLFDRISVYNETTLAYPQLLLAIPVELKLGWTALWTNHFSENLYVHRGPPDKGVSIMTLFCVYRI